MESRSARYITKFKWRSSWFRALAFAVGVAGGLVSMFAGPSPSRRTPSRRARSFAGVEALLGSTSDFAALQTAIFGRSKREVARVLGPPPTAHFEDAPPAIPGHQADTWYYPFDSQRHSAIAVQFDNDRVIRVDYIGGLI